ncbi:hypothetical protein OAB13_02640 [Salibacteraceae bacterium]|jgi:hypothetical protein|nr:hypothetical protein [Salibacteraceae bacterium]MDC1305120.1 hypothetical protein [Salibacteraceae bacterium]
MNVKALSNLLSARCLTSNQSIERGTWAHAFSNDLVISMILSTNVHRIALN